MLPVSITTALEFEVAHAFSVAGVAEPVKLVVELTKSSEEPVIDGAGETVIVPVAFTDPQPPVNGIE
jgi:hypothetical protein